MDEPEILTDGSTVIERTRQKVVLGLAQPGSIKDPAAPTMAELRAVTAGTQIPAVWVSERMLADLEEG